MHVNICETDGQTIGPRAEASHVSTNQFVLWFISIVSIEQVAAAVFLQFVVWADWQNGHTVKEKITRKNI